MPREDTILCQTCKVTAQGVASAIGTAIGRK